MKNVRCIDIIKEYYDKYKFVLTNQNHCWARERLKQIGIPSYTLYLEDGWYVFALLHEIGHCEIFDGRYKQSTSEFLATQWAINNCKTYNVQLSEEQQNEWQEYIYSFCNDKDKGKYKLDWRNM